MRTPQYFPSIPALAMPTPAVASCTLMLEMSQGCKHDLFALLVRECVCMKQQIASGDCVPQLCTAAKLLTAYCASHRALAKHVTLA